MLLHFLNAIGGLMAVKVSMGPTGPIIGIPETLFLTNVPGRVTAFRTHYVPRDYGQQFLTNTESQDRPKTPISVVLNWTAKFKK